MNWMSTAAIILCKPVHITKNSLDWVELLSNERKCLFTYKPTKPTKWRAPSEDSGQPGPPPSLIRAFPVPTKTSKESLAIHRAQSEDSDQTGQTGHFVGFVMQWLHYYMDRDKRIWYLSPMRAAKVQASLRIRAFSPEPSLLAYISSESRGTFRQKARSLAPLNGWACAVKICNDGMLEDTNSLDAAHILIKYMYNMYNKFCQNT